MTEVLYARRSHVLLKCLHIPRSSPSHSRLPDMRNCPDFSPETISQHLGNHRDGFVSPPQARLRAQLLRMAHPAHTTLVSHAIAYSPSSPKNDRRPSRWIVPIFVLKSSSTVSVSPIPSTYLSTGSNPVFQSSGATPAFPSAPPRMAADRFSLAF